MPTINEIAEPIGSLETPNTSIETNQKHAATVIMIYLIERKIGPSWPYLDVIKMLSQ